VTSFAESFLASTNATISQVLNNEAVQTPDQMGRAGLSAIAGHLCLSPNAKRARPLLCLYSHWLFNDRVDEQFVRVGVAAEFIHAASLLHDDVVDEASKRRGLSSANSVFGNAQAVLAGNFLLTKAFDLLRPFPRALADRAITVVGEMTQSALLEINSRASLQLDEHTWRRIARGKTGVLFSWCSFAAAICAKEKAEAHKLWAAGQSIGEIFQMADDLKDFSGDSNLKDKCQDIRNKEPSLPIILAQKSSPEVLAAFKRCYESEVLNDEQVGFLKEQVLASGALTLTQKYMQKTLVELRDMLAIYDGTLGKTYLDHWVSSLIE
jgi:geranylgeranyl pyrophosphate synthase